MQFCIWATHPLGEGKIPTCRQGKGLQPNQFPQWRACGITGQVVPWVNRIECMSWPGVGNFCTLQSFRIFDHFPGHENLTKTSDKVVQNYFVYVFYRCITMHKDNKRMKIVPNQGYFYFSLKIWFNMVIRSSRFYSQTTKVNDLNGICGCYFWSLLIMHITHEEKHNGWHDRKCNSVQL